MMKAEPSRQIPRKPTEYLQLLILFDVAHLEKILNSWLFCVLSKKYNS